MKFINYIYKKANLFIVFLFGWLFSATMIFVLFYFLTTDNGKLVINSRNCFTVAAASGVLFGLMFMMMISLGRRSDKFWEYSEDVSKLIDKAETKKDLESVFNNEFQTLRKLAQGGPHIGELSKHYYTMQTKYKYVR